MWLALKLFGFGKTLLDMGLRFFAWLCEDWLRLVVAGFVILSAVLWFRGNDYRSERNDAQAGWKAEINAHKQTEANYREASAQALAAAKENKVRVETKYVEIENAQDKDIRARLAAATASLRARSASSDSSGSNAISLPSPSNATVDPAGAGIDPIMDDALICTTNTVKAQGWQDWYAEAQAVTRQ
jgi:hypothetical protein